MITHVVLFRWKPETTPETLEEIVAALHTMPELVPSIGTYVFGSDLGANGAANMDLAIVATFATIEDWRDYDTHPEHDRIRAEIIRPWIAERASVQFPS